MTDYTENLEETVKELRTLLGLALMDCPRLSDYRQRDIRGALARSEMLLTTHAITARVNDTPSD